MRTISAEWRDYIHRAIQNTELPNKSDGVLCFAGKPLTEYDPESLALIAQFMMCTAYDMQKNWAKHQEFMDALKKNSEHP